MLQVNDLHCERDRRVLFSDLNFTMAPGNMLQIAGGNGVGKTTLLKIVTGLYTDFSGEVLWDLTSAPLYLGHRLGVHSQLTVAENWRWYCDLYGGDVTRVDEVAAKLGLIGYELSRPDQLSEGQVKRVALGRFLLCDAECWILDEPFSALDTSGIAAVQSILDEQVSTGGSVVLTNHQGSIQGDNKQLLELGA